MPFGRVIVGLKTIKWCMFILKNLDMLYLIFISAHMVLKEKFGHVILNVYIYTYGFERKFWCMLYLTIKATLVTTYL